MLSKSEGIMDKEYKKNSIDKFLSKIQDHVELLECLVFWETVIKFEQNNGRKMAWDEKRNLAQKKRINLCKYREEFLANFSSNGFVRVTH
jgi:hypothetical protein